MRRFEDQSVVITGGSRGVGRALVEAFAAEGAAVSFSFVQNESKAREVETAVRRQGGQAYAYPLDVRDPQACSKWTDAVADARGLHVAIANAAITHDGFGAMLDAQDFADVVDVNLRGVFHLARSAGRTLMARGTGGAIVTVGSIASLRVHPGQVAYASAKAGVLALTRSFAHELAPRGIRVNAVVGGLLDVGMAARLGRRDKDRLLEHVPLGRAGKAEELAAAALFLASPEASYIVGHALVVDGGATL